MEAVDASLQSSRIEDAVAIAQRLVEVAPPRSDIFELLGRTHIALAESSGDPSVKDAARKEAARAYAMAIELGDPSAGLLNSAGVTAQAAGDLGGAILAFERACRKDPTNAQHPLFLGLALMRAQRLAEADAALALAQKLDPESPWAFSARSDIALRSGDGQAALELARKARSLAPRNDELRVAEAKALRKLALHGETLTLLLALPDESRSTEAIAWEVAAAHEGMGDLIAAAKAWELWAQASTTRQSATDAARRWNLAGDPVQAASWDAIARSRAPSAADSN